MSSVQSIGAGVVYTGEGVRRDAWLNFREDRIVSLTAAAAGEEIGHYPVLTPAFIDPHCHIGMERAGEPGREGEANEHLDSLMPLADALDSVQMDDASFRESVEAGFLYSCVVPGSGNIIGGLSAVIRNYAKDTNAAFIARAGLKAAFGYNPMSTHDWKGNRPHTRMGCLALLRQEFCEIRNKRAAAAQATSKGKAGKPGGELSPRQLVMAEVLDGRTVLRVHVHKTDDIAALLRFVDEYGIRVTVEHACDVHEEGTFRELARREIPVVYGPMDSFPYKVELRHESWRNLRHLLASGVDHGLMSDHPVILQRNLFQCLRFYLRLGWGPAEAIGVLTRQNAVVLGLDDRLGTLAKGKWASFVAWTGDPFTLAAYPAAVYGEGCLLHCEQG
jgi:imidazolonepropionase-like amidohydrolase